MGMMRTSLLLVVCLLFTVATALASDTDPLQSGMEPGDRDTFDEAFFQDIQPHPLQVNSTQGFKAKALDEFIPVHAEDSGVVEEVKSLVKSTVTSTVGLLRKPPTILFSGIRNILDFIPGAGSKPERVETVEEAVIAPALKLNVGDKEPHTFFEREFAKRLASHRTAEDFTSLVEEGQRSTKIIKILILREDFGSKK